MSEVNCPGRIRRSHRSNYDNAFTLTMSVMLLSGIFRLRPPRLAAAWGRPEKSHA